MTIRNLGNVADIIAHWAERTPDAEALALDDLRLTYAELNASVERLAWALSRAGVGPGDRVATLQTPHPDYMVAFLAAASIGAVWVGLNPRYQRDELLRVLTDSQPRLLITRTRIEGRDYAPDLDAIRQAVPDLEPLVVFDGDPVPGGARGMSDFVAAAGPADLEAVRAARARVAPRDPCLIVYTSGSTGLPKGALLHHQGIVRFSAAQNAVWPCAPLRTMNYFPINHVGCVIDVSMPTMAAGGLMVFMEHFEPRRCLELMAREKVTLWATVPSVFRLQLALEDFGDFDLSAVQLIVWEGAAMPREMLPELMAVCPRLATNYGMTEACGAVTVLAPTSDVDLLAASVGEPLEGVEVRLVGPDDGAPVADGEAGEVWTRSDYNLLGYWRQPEATAEAITPDGFFRTGDLAVRLPNGHYRIVGRLKEMYKSGGYNVYPREVEAVLEQHPAVALAAVVSTPDPLWQEVGVAFVAPRGPVEAAALEAHCRERLANYKIPKRIVVSSDLPLLPVGKIDKIALKKALTA